ncbi:hypothetical protein RhiirA5_419773 [Rhizophagus irregularis]|uniref:Uncharacterized protein n=1 Tax=Rhizophagus irregularis TaxID=588596 RepID=A0A2N0PHL6_9GLOM|nr:hypothetical protein RhiirA5_419773 [Rhizophagus irregularis]
MDSTEEHSIHEEKLTSTYDDKTKKVNEKDTNNNDDYDVNNDNYDGEEEEEDDDNEEEDDDDDDDDDEEEDDDDDNDNDGEEEKDDDNDGEEEEDDDDNVDEEEKDDDNDGEEEKDDDNDGEEEEEDDDNVDEEEKDDDNDDEEVEEDDDDGEEEEEDDNDGEEEEDEDNNDGVKEDVDNDGEEENDDDDSEEENNDDNDGEEEDDDDHDGKEAPREVDNELLALVIQTNNKLKELGYNSLIINSNIAQENDSSQERWERRISSNTTTSKYANIEKLAQNTIFHSLDISELSNEITTQLEQAIVNYLGRNSIGYIMNNYNEGKKENREKNKQSEVIQYYASLLKCPQELEQKIKNLATKIIKTYDESLHVGKNNSNKQRTQTSFKHKKQQYFVNNKKGYTCGKNIDKEQLPEQSTINTTMTTNITSRNNLNIIYAFPDLDYNGKQLYQKKPKLEMFKNIYINAGMQIPGEIEKDEIEGEEEIDEEE